LSIVLIYLAAFLVYIGYHADMYAQYFKKKGVVEAAKEYQFSKKLFYVAVAITIFLFSLGGKGGVLYYFYGQLSDQQDYILYYIWLFFVTIFSLAAVILGIRFALQYARKNFNFYLTRAYYLVSFREEGSIQKFKYLILALDTYNKFLERNLKMKIKDIMCIYSILVLASAEQKTKVRESIGKALEKDELELARQLAELSNLQDKEQFFIRKRAILNQDFKDILTIIIPAVISIVGSIIAILTQAGIFGSQPSS